MRKHPIVTAGDVGQTLITQLSETLDAGRTTLVINFTGLVTSVEAHAWPRTGDTASVNLDATFTDAATGEITVSLGGPGGWLPSLTQSRQVVVEFLVEYEVTFTGGDVRTWGPDILPVRGQGA